MEGEVMNLIQALYDLKNDANSDLRKSELLKFVAACFKYAEVSQSQNYQDIFALYKNHFRKNGFFVEFGATDGITGSNTYLLERDFYWSGILAEPNKVWHSSLAANRNCDISDKCVFTVTGETVEFVTTEDAALSTVKGFGLDDEFGHVRKNAPTVQVETISLLDLLKEYNAPETIDFMSVDTEGTEYGILNAFFQQNKNQYNIRCVTVEHNFTPMRDKIHTLMAVNGYTRKFTEISRWDDFFVKGGEG
jgi:FkbM family methyltransferase